MADHAPVRPMEKTAAVRQLEAVGWLRALTPNVEQGGSEPHLFETPGGPFLAKVSNNPQGPRVLPNELVGGLCLDWLGVTHPHIAVINVPQSVIDDSPGAKFKS